MASELNEQRSAPSEGSPGGASSGGSAAVQTRPRQSPPRTDKLPPWRVLLHNDDVNILEDVIKAIQQIVKLNHLEALKRTLEAHKSGVALLLTTHREHAELLQQQFETKLLTVSIELEN